MSATKDKIVKTAGARGKTKSSIAEAIGLSSNHVGTLVNELVNEGRLVFDRTTSTGAAVFRKVKETESTIRSLATSSTTRSRKV